MAVVLIARALLAALDDLELAERARAAGGRSAARAVRRPGARESPRSRPTPTWCPRRTARRRRRSWSCSPPSARTTGSSPRRAPRELRHDGQALGRRPARRHDQLPLRLPGLVGERRARGRGRRRSPASSTIPLRGETFRAERGRGADAGRARRSRVRDSGDLGTALIATGFGYDAGRQGGPGTRRCGASSRRSGTCAAAAPPRSTSPGSRPGRVDGYCERGLNPWDWAAGSLLVREAGGAVEALDGEPRGLAAAGPALLPALVALVRDAEAAAGPS